MKTTILRIGVIAFLLNSTLGLWAEIPELTIQAVIDELIQKK